MRSILPDIRQVLSCGVACFALLLLLTAPMLASAADQRVQNAISLMEKDEFADALVLLHQMERSLPEPSQVAILLSSAYLGQGYQLLSANRFAAARESFQNGRTYNADDVRHWQGEAMTYFKEGQYAQAASLLNEALGIAPQNPEIHHLLGMAYYAEGRMAETLDALESAREFGGGDDVAELLVKVRREWQVESEMETEYRGHFQLSYVDGGHATSLAAEILAVLEDAYAELGSELNFYPDLVVPVLLYSHRDYAAVTRSPDWAGAVYDGKIRLPLAGLSQMTDHLASLLYHEYTHVLVHFLANRHAPVWLNEGLAEFSGRRINNPPFVALPQAIKSGRMLDWQTLEKPFTGLPTADVKLAYEQSYALTEFMIDRYGWYKIAELLRVLGTRLDWRSSVAKVYGEYGLDWPAILREWQAGQG